MNIDYQCCMSYLVQFKTKVTLDFRQCSVFLLQGGIQVTLPRPFFGGLLLWARSYPKTSRMAHRTLVLPPRCGVPQSRDALSTALLCIFSRG